MAYLYPHILIDLIFQNTSAEICCPKGLRDIHYLLSPEQVWHLGMLEFR